MKKSIIGLVMLLMMVCMLGCGLGTSLERLNNDPGSIVEMEVNENFEMAFQKFKDNFDGFTEGHVYSETGKAVLRNDSHFRPIGFLFDATFIRLDANKTKIVIHSLPSWHEWAQSQISLYDGKITKAVKADDSWYKRN